MLDRVIDRWRETRFSGVLAVEHAPDHGLPRGAKRLVFDTAAVTIYRPAMIAGHTTRGIGNRDDFLTRYLAGTRHQHASSGARWCMPRRNRDTR